MRDVWQRGKGGDATAAARARSGGDIGNEFTGVVAVEMGVSVAVWDSEG